MPAAKPFLNILRKKEPTANPIALCQIYSFPYLNTLRDSTILKDLTPLSMCLLLTRLNFYSRSRIYCLLLNNFLFCVTYLTILQLITEGQIDLFLFLLGQIPKKRKYLVKPCLHLSPAGSTCLCVHGSARYSSASKLHKVNYVAAGRLISILFMVIIRLGGL